MSKNNIHDENEFQALSIVAPNGARIANGLKTLEVRSWVPEILPLKNLVIVENQYYLTHDCDEDLGQAVAIVDVVSVHPWHEDEFEAACASYWAEGYYAWVLDNVRPIYQDVQVQAKRKIYRVSFELKL